MQYEPSLTTGVRNGTPARWQIYSFLKLFFFKIVKLEQFTQSMLMA